MRKPELVLRFIVELLVLPFWPLLVLILIIGIYFKRPSFIKFVDCDNRAEYGE